MNGTTTRYLSRFNKVKHLERKKIRDEIKAFYINQFKEKGFSQEEAEDSAEGTIKEYEDTFLPDVVHQAIKKSSWGLWRTIWVGTLTSALGTFLFGIVAYGIYKSIDGANKFTNDVTDRKTTESIPLPELDNK